MDSIKELLDEPADLTSRLRQRTFGELSQDQEKTEGNNGEEEE